MKLQSRYLSVICLLLGVGVVGNQLLTGCVAFSLPVEPTSTPPAFPSPQWYTGPTVPDPRIARLREEYGIVLSNQNCAAPCYNGLDSKIALARFVELLGPPMRVYSIYELSAYRFNVVLVYVKEGMLVYAQRPLFEHDVYSNEMTPDMSVDRIDLLRSRTLKEMDQELTEWRGLHNRIERAQEWRGFGPVPP
ncbi:MAG: hypothetical protein HZB53_00515 [Chloroflexi bacterium]|nr:hypothetical protein [Chloroflexota bacterium]